MAPASVRATRRVVRASNFTPRRRSSSEMRLLTAEVVVRSMRAARVKERDSTTRANTARACRSSSGSDCFPMGKYVFATGAGSQAGKGGIDSRMTATTADSHSPVATQDRSRSLLGRLAKTDDAVAPAIARIALGAVIFPHGAQKL